MKIKIPLFFAAVITWLVLSWSIDIEHTLSGIMLGLLVSFLTAEIFPEKTLFLKRPLRYLWFFYYFPLFVWESIKANIDGAYRVIHPALPFKPGIVKVKTALRSDVALTFLANTITLQPGTMTVDIDKENGFLYVHWVEVRTQDPEEAARIITEKFERILKRIFE
ncbi:MAG TPA: Na+/H+ antiporter subunit E [Candidatus Margulisiibacteriota bacterium]|nr:Na+/H+ antiporter subunit E [Candidatus Margulisiibacteriota bacterium]